MKEKQSGIKITKLSYATLIVASIATMATSPGLEFSVRHLIVYENVIYVDGSYNYGEGIPNEIPYSMDGGNSWSKISIQDSPVTVKNNLGKFPQLPVTVCLPNDPEVCYRTDTESIVQSFDGGKTWRASWSIPVGRKKFIQRNGFPVYNGNRELELGPYDLILLNQNGRQVLVAAAGREGLLIKSGESNWKRQGVFGAGPTPYKTDDFWKALEIIINEIISYSLAAFIFVFLHVIVNAKKHDNKVFIILMTASILAILSPSMVFLYSKFLYSRHIGSFFFSDLYFSIISPVGNLVFWISTMIAMVLLLHQLITNTYHSSIGLGVIIIIWGISWILFVLWAFSIIQTYETAAAIAISLNGAFLVWLLYQLIQRVLKKGASTPVLDNKKT